MSEISIRVNRSKRCPEQIRFVDAARRIGPARGRQTGGYCKTGREVASFHRIPHNDAANNPGRFRSNGAARCRRMSPAAGQRKGSVSYERVSGRQDADLVARLAVAPPPAKINPDNPESRPRAYDFKEASLTAVPMTARISFFCNGWSAPGISWKRFSLARFMAMTWTWNRLVMSISRRLLPAQLSTRTSRSAMNSLNGKKSTKPGIAKPFSTTDDAMGEG